MLQSLHLSKGRQATWLELFFDLVFVAVIGVVTDDLAHTEHGHLSVEQFFRFPLVFVPVWWIWTTHTLYANRFDNNDRVHRLCALFIMAVLVLLSTFVPESLGKKFSVFAGGYVGVRAFLAFLYVRIHSKHKSDVSFAHEMAVAILIGALISAAATLFTGMTKFLIFYSGIAVDMVLQFKLRKKTQEFPVDRKHLVERIGLLAIIILGESVISMVRSLSEIPVWDNFTIAAAVTGFAMVWAIWWIYFDSFSNLERTKEITDGNILIYTHLILCMGLIILADLIGFAIKGDLDRETFRILAIIGMSGFYVGKQVIYYVCFPPFRKMIVVNTVVCLTITVFSTYLPRIEYSMMGMAFAMLLYVYSTIKWLLPNNIEPYLIAPSH